MANASQVFKDDEEEKSYGRPSDDELRHITGISPEDEADIDSDAAEELNEQESNPSGGGPSDSGAVGASSLLAGEKGGNGSEGRQTGDNGFVRQDADITSGKLSRRRRVMGKIQGLSRHKVLTGVAIGGGGGTIIGLIFLLIIASSLKIPNLAQNITGYEFARLTREYSDNAQRDTEASLGLSATSDKAYTALRARYSALDAAHVKASTMFGKLDAFRPQVAIKNLNTDNGLTYIYKQGVFNRQRLVGLTVNDTTYLIEQQGASRYIPGIGSLINFKNNVNFARQVEPVVTASLLENDTGLVVRSIATKKVLQEAGVSLDGLIIARFANTDARDARIQEEQEKIQAVKNAPPDDASTSSIKQSEEATVEAGTELAGNPAELEQVIKTGTVPTIKAAIGKSLESSGFTDVIGTINPVYAVAQPVCIVYDGSVDKSGPTIDNQTDEQMRSYGFIASVADQEKTGSVAGQSDTGLANAVAAADDDAGDITQSNAYIRANSGVANTTDMISSEAGADGEFTLLNASGLPAGFAGLANKFAGHVCPALTNPYGAVGIGLANVVATIFTGGADEVPEQTAQQSAKVVVKDVADTALKRLLVNSTSYANTAGKLVFDTAKSAGKIAAITIAAKLEVASKAGELNSGFSQGKDLANQADCGGGLLANEINRKTLYGRPLLTPEVAQSSTSDQQFVADMNSQQSTFDRYLSTSNSNSLLSHAAIDVNAHVHGSIIDSLISTAASMFNPLHVVGAYGGHAAAAGAITPTDAYCGNVQFGWSNSEESLIDSNDNYKPLENQDILDSATINGQDASDYILGAYGSCFSDSLGTLLSTGEIVRDADGNVINNNSAKCSPEYLSTNNPTLAAINTTYADLVFRWRLSQAYNVELDQLNNEQTIGTDASDDSSTSAAGTTASAGQLAEAILGNKNISLTGRDVEQDISDAASAQAGTAGAMTSAAILNLINTVGKTNTVTISSIQGGGTGHCNNTPKAGCPTEPHYNGDAVDFSEVNGQDLTGRDTGSLAIIQIAESILPSGSRFGQLECGATPPLPSGFTDFNDTCNHLHVDVPLGTP